VRNWPALLWTSSLAQAEATREGVSWDPGRVPSCWPGALTVVVGAAVIVACKWVFFCREAGTQSGDSVRHAAGNPASTVKVP
jgi:hypothetical protein